MLVILINDITCPTLVKKNPRILILLKIIEATSKGENIYRFSKVIFKNTKIYFVLTINKKYATIQ